MAKPKLKVVYPLEKGVDGVMYDCTSCGACCGPNQQQPGWPEITVKDASRLTDKEFQKAVSSEPWMSLKTKMTSHAVVVCHFLKGTVGKQATCSIYARRPDVCRGFKPGTTECKAHRTEKRIKLLNTLYGVADAGNR